jgi:phage major head subunit gpT-like protein
MPGPTIAQKAKYADVEVGVTLEFMDALERQGPDPVMVLASEMNSSAAVEEHFFLGDVPQFEEWKNDRVMATLMAHKFRIPNKDFASGIAIHRNEISDDQMGKVSPRIATLAKRAARHRGDYMTKLLINGFAGNTFSEVGDGLGFDGALFFSAVHSLEGGPNQSNTMGAVALTETSLQDADVRLMSLTTWDGKDPLDLQGTHLFVGPKLLPLATKLVGAPTLINTGGTAAAENPYLRGRYQVVLLPRLVGAYDDYWFLGDLDEATKPFIFQDREAINTAAQTDWSSPDMFRRGQMNFGAQARYGLGYYDWRTIVGANP